MTTRVQVNWIGPGLRLLGETASGQAVVMDHVLEGEQRAESGARPMELLLIGMLGCTAMDVVSILQKQRQPFIAVQVTASAERASEHPKIYTQIAVEYVVRGHGVDPKGVERAIELSRTKYCSAMAMLGQAAQISTSYRIEET
jgi:putative redox protein